MRLALPGVMRAVKCISSSSSLRTASSPERLFSVCNLEAFVFDTSLPSHFARVVRFGVLGSLVGSSRAIIPVQVA